jgi:hypothetical protein
MSILTEAILQKISLNIDINIIIKVFDESTTNQTACVIKHIKRDGIRTTKKQIVVEITAFHKVGA